MTMLYSLYAAEGIIFASDSRIIRLGAKQAEPPQQKVRRVYKVGLSTGLIGYYGLAQVKGEAMSSWLATLIGRWPGSREPERFADLVVDRLNRDAWARERKHVSGLHFGAFRKNGDRVEPVFFHIVNTHGFDDTTGLHTDPGDEWRCEEQLMGRDVARHGWVPSRIRQHLRERQRAVGMALWYRNGDMPVFGPITGFLEVAIAHVVRRRGYGAPNTLSGWERMARALVVTTSQLARALYKGKVPTIGDRARVLSVEWPAGGL
jgi:hypothetical protein